MDLQNQQRVLEAAEEYGAENVVVILGSSDAEGAGLYAETVTAGDPTYAGPLTGVSLGLPVYHVFDEAIKGEADQSVWDEQISMMEMVLDTPKLAEAVAEMRHQHGKHEL
jgi:glycine/sarcosine/betaine reductase complex component A